MADISSSLPVVDKADGTDGAAAPSVAIQVAGKDGSGNLQTLLTDTNGVLTVAGSGTAGTPSSAVVSIQGITNGTAINAAPVDGSKATYSAGKLGLVPTTTDVFTITGSATKIIRVTRVEVSFIQSIYNINEVQLIKRSTANTGGTSTSILAVSHDSTNAAATATVLAYTANPTLGTSLGVVRTVKLYGDATNQPSGENVITWDFGTRPAQAIVLRGTTQVLAVNLNGVSISGASFDISIEWTEE